MTTALIVFAVSLFLSAVFSGYETGFISSNPIRVNYLATEENSKGAKRLLRHMRNPEQLLATLLICNNIVNVAATIVIAREAARFFGDAWGDLATWVLVTPALLIFGELVPKSVFRTHPNRLAIRMLPFIQLCYIVFAPLAVPFTFLTRRLMVGRSAQAMSPLMSSLEDLRVLVDESAEHGTIRREEQEMIHSVIDLQDTQAQEIMVPRIKVQALPATAGRDELLDLFENTGRSRIPIYRETVDEIVGVINVYEVMLDKEPDNPEIGRFIREVRRVPDTLKVDDLLKDLKASQNHMAIVMDEYGGTHGVVTLEDILEEIFGEIQDEHDREERLIQKVGRNAYVVDARMPLSEAGEAMSVDLTDEEVDTVGGWVMHVAGRIPAQGEIIEHEGFRLTVLDGGPNFVAKVRVDIADEVRQKHDTEG